MWFIKLCPMKHFILISGSTSSSSSSSEEISSSSDDEHSMQRIRGRKVLATPAVRRLALENKVTCDQYFVKVNRHATGNSFRSLIYLVFYRLCIMDIFITEFSAFVGRNVFLFDILLLQDDL